MTRLIQFVCGRLLGSTVYIYVDDCFCVELSTTIHSAHDSFRTLCEILGFALATGKAQAPAKSLILLGALAMLHPDRVSACLPGRKRFVLPNGPGQILMFDHLNPAQAAKCRGRLGFAQSLVFGRVGRALTQPLSARQYSRVGGRKHPLTAELGEPLEWRISILDTAAPPRSTFRYVEADFILYGCFCWGAIAEWSLS